MTLCHCKYFVPVQLTWYDNDQLMQCVHINNALYYIYGTINGCVELVLTNYLKSGFVNWA